MKYTVLVQVPPDEPTDPLGIYFALVETPDLKSAIARGRREAWFKRGGRERGEFKRWRCAYVLQGHAKLEHIAGWTR